MLGLWHPKYVEPAVRILPYLQRAHIGMSPRLARKYFWDACSSFSMNFSCLVGSDGELFRQECKLAGKDLCQSMPSPLATGSISPHWFNQSGRR